MIKMRFLSAILLLAFLTVGGFLLRQHYGISDYVPPTPGTASCAWHDRAGTHLSQNGITAYVRTGGTDVNPQVTSFICENGYLYSAQGQSWPATAVADSN